jgi:hypothetical protein
MLKKTYAHLGCLILISSARIISTIKSHILISFAHSENKYIHKLKILNKTDPQHVSVFTQAQKDSGSIQYLSLPYGLAYLLL